MNAEQKWQNLVRSWPSLERHAAAWKLDDADEILESLGVVFEDGRWCCGARAPWHHTGSVFAALFSLDVWNKDTRDLLPEHLCRWSLIDAFAHWDVAHRKIALVYMQDPFYP